MPAISRLVTAIAPTINEAAAIFATADLAIGRIDHDLEYIETWSLWTSLCAPSNVNSFQAAVNNR
jgi:hypothetical protein